MKVFIDESGSCCLDAPEPSLVVSLICPDSFYSELCYFLQRFEERLGVAEAKGSALDPENRLRICRFLKRNCKSLTATVHFVRPERVSVGSLHAWRDMQAKKFQQNKEDYVARGGSGQGILKYFDRLLKIALYASRLSDAEFLEALMIVENVRLTLQHSIVYYTQRKWETSFDGYEFIVDRKLPGKLSPMEKYIHNTLLPFLDGGSRTRAYEPLVIPDWWRADHPFRTNFQVPDGIDLKRIFAKRVQFLDSSQVSGLRIVDIAANTIFGFLKMPRDPLLAECYGLLRSCLAGGNTGGRRTYMHEIVLQS